MDFSQEYVVLQDAMLNGKPQYTHATYINIMYVLDSRRQKGEFLIGNPKRPIECAVEIRQTI